MERERALLGRASGGRAPAQEPARRRPLVAGNWKMNGLRAEGVELVRRLARDLGRPAGGTAGPASDLGLDVVVCPPFTALAEVGRALAGTAVDLGAQSLSWADKGALTGEISGPMLVEAGCRWVIIGHSERRQHFGETDETAGRRLAAAARNSLRPILCVGETWEEREAGRTEEVVGRQLRGAFAAYRAEGGGGRTGGGEGAPAAPEGLAVAYEPVWAIGTGRAARGGDAQEVAHFIRRVLEEAFGPETAVRTPVLYGGSVKPDNIAEFAAEPDIDGALVGGASLDPAAFAAIVRRVLG